MAYRVAPATARLVRAFKLMHTEFYALTNLLAGRAVVPEFLQEQATPEALAAAVDAQLYDEGHAGRLGAIFRELHEGLRRGASDRAAQAVIKLAARS